jgi:hypothetical protein
VKAFSFALQNAAWSGRSRQGLLDDVVRHRCAIGFGRCDEEALVMMRALMRSVGPEPDEA